MIGIITMHRVLNFGSILQAYALQKTLLKLGFENEIIDYEFPPKNSVTLIRRYNLKIKKFIYDILVGDIFKKSKQKYFDIFIKDNIILSNIRYNKHNIVQANNNYKILLTGSDQVWNPRWINGDMSFLLSFAKPDKKCLSYASSFTVDKIPNNLTQLYSKELSKYNYITVREESGIKLVKELCGKMAKVVCDPTLLLEESEYRKISSLSTIIIEEPYILVYILDYMFNPFPEINNIVKSVHEQLGYKVIYIGRKYEKYNKDCINFENIGPSEFIYLIEHSSFVITTSFHGSAFASIFHKPLLAVVKDNTSQDGRIPTLLENTGAMNSLKTYNSESNVNFSDISKFTCSSELLNIYRENSIRILKNMILK